MTLIARNLIAGPLWAQILQLALIGVILFALGMRIYCAIDDHR